MKPGRTPRLVVAGGVPAVAEPDTGTGAAAASEAVASAAADTCSDDSTVAGEPRAAS
jgi:hypothetical protein